MSDFICDPGSGKYYRLSDVVAVEPDDDGGTVVLVRNPYAALNGQPMTRDLLFPDLDPADVVAILDGRPTAAAQRARTEAIREQLREL